MITFNFRGLCIWRTVRHAKYCWGWTLFFTFLTFFILLIILKIFLQLQNDPQFQPYYNLLHLFAYGTYLQFLSMKDSLPELTLSQHQKLKHLTIVTLSETNKVLKYELLLNQLDMKNLRELEDLVIEAIYGGKKNFISLRPTSFPHQPHFVPH